MTQQTNECDKEGGCRFIALCWPSWSQRKRLLRREAWIFVIASYVVVTFAYLWPPAFECVWHPYVAIAWTAFLVRTFIFHLGLLLAVVAVGVAWARNLRLLVVITPLLAVTLGPSLWLYLPKAPPHADGETITVMSVNLLMVNRSTVPIVREIEAEDPDLVLFQEYTHHWHEALQAGLGPVYPHVTFVRREDSFGAAIYSKSPFVGEVNRYLPLGSATEPQLRAVVQLAGRHVAVYNVHLLPPWGMEYVIETRLQFADLVRALEQETLPVVLAGDFNFTDLSPNAAALRRAGLADAFDQGGWGQGSTWPVSPFFRWIPSIRLDHIYLGGGLVCTESRTGKGEGSDHRPVIAKVAFMVPAD